MKADAPATVLSVQDLAISYGAANAVRGVSLEVKAGELVAIIGNNGAGKTSILRGISGLVRPSGGRVTFHGDDVTGQPAHRMVSRGLALIPEGRMIFADQSVADNLLLGAYQRLGRERAAVEADFDKVYALFPRLHERRAQLAGSLSGGEQQMLAIGRGLLAKPRLLMIDELSLGLAPKIVTQLMGVLKDLNRDYLTILLVEQLASHALAIADRAYVVTNGRITHSGAAATLARDPDVMEAFLGKKRVH